MIIENQYKEDIQRIWKENNEGYISSESNEKAINDENMTQLVWRQDNQTMAYAIVYEGKDLCKKDGFPNQIKNMPEKVAYIWEIVTDKPYLRRGIAGKLLDYIIQKYDDYSLYSCIDISNIPSLQMHTKRGFQVLYQFEKEEKGKTNSYFMLEKRHKQ